MEEIRKCNLCGNQNFRFLFENNDKMLNFQEKFKLYQCESCGLIFLNPQPNKKELEKHYPKSYYSLKGKYPKRFKLNLYKRVYSKNQIEKVIYSIFRPVLRRFKVVKDGRYLDVGCGSGEMLIIMRELGMESFGLEPYGFDKKFAEKHKLNITSKTLGEVKFPKEYFDCITFSFVLEHMDDPASVFKESSRILKRGGSLIISVPQSNSVAYKIFRENWLTLDTPRHLYIFSLKNLKEYARKNSLQIKNVRYISGIGGLWGSWIYYTNKNREKKKYLAQKKFFWPRILLYGLIPVSSLMNLLRIGDTIEIEFSKN